MDKSLSRTRRRHSVIAFEMIQLDRTAREPLYQQLYRQIRDELASGSFGDNFSRLPCSRQLAADLRISRPTVRLAFSKLLVPEQLVDSMIKIRAVMDQHSSAIDQATLARFLTEGFLLSHIRRMRQLYSDRRELFVEEFNHLLRERFTLQTSEAGLHFVAWLRCKADFPVVMRFGHETGVRLVVPLSFYCMEAEPKPAFVFGFAAWSAAQIREGLTKLASALKEKRQKYSVAKQVYIYVSPCGYVENWRSNPAE